MARPSRIEFPGAIYLVSSHRAPATPGAMAFADDTDRAAFLALLARATQRFDSQVLAYCLLSDGFELLLFTRQANLSRLMRHLNGIYSQHHRRRHGGGQGSLFQGRFKAALVDRESRLFDAVQHVELGAVRSGLLDSAAELGRWPWSSYPAHTGQQAAPAWLDVEGLHAHLLGRPAMTAADRRRAAQRHAKLTLGLRDADRVGPHLRQQIYVGDAAFAERMASLGRATQAPDPAARRRPASPLTWSDWLGQSSSREQALYQAHTRGGWSMTALAAELDLSVSRVSRVITLYERGLVT